MTMIDFEQASPINTTGEVEESFQRFTHHSPTHMSNTVLSGKRDKHRRIVIGKAGVNAWRRSIMTR
jgi:hypothetical protein